MSWTPRTEEHNRKRATQAVNTSNSVKSPFLVEALLPSKHENNNNNFSLYLQGDQPGEESSVRSSGLSKRGKEGEKETNHTQFCTETVERLIWRKIKNNYNSRYRK